MKKFLSIIVLSLLWCNNSNAGHSGKIDLIIPQPKCNGVELKVHHNDDIYFFYIENPTNKKIIINYVTFFTKDEDVMTRSNVTKVILPFHKDRFWLKQSKLMHQYLQKILVGCDSK